jgi:voltage-gated potassium channel
VHAFLDAGLQETKLDKAINTFLIVLIILNTAAVIFETEESIYAKYYQLFHDFDVFSVAIFTIEYILRLWVCTDNPKYQHPVKGRLKYIFSWGALVDLVAILPFYLPILFGLDLRFIRMFRLMRFFRFFKLGRYMTASKLVVRVIQSKKEELVISFIITMFLILMASCLMYYTEHDVQPEKFSSIPHTMWWSVATLTTVGYGDIYPITPLGKTLTAFISILGIGIFALPTGILASGFSEEFKKLKKKVIICPHCGEDIDLEHPEFRHIH